MTLEPADTVHASNGRQFRLLKGLAAGAIIGTLAAHFLPRVRSTLHSRWGQVTNSAAALGKATNDRYRRSSRQVGDAVQGLQSKSRGVYGKALTAVAAGAHQVEGKAVKAKTALDRGTPPVSPPASR